MYERGATHQADCRVGGELIRRQVPQVPTGRSTRSPEAELHGERSFHLYWDPRRRVLLRTR